MTENSTEANGGCYRFLTIRHDVWKKCEADEWRTVGAGTDTRAVNRLKSVQAGDRLVCYMVSESGGPVRKRWFGVLEVVAPHDPEVDVQPDHPFPNRLRVRVCLMLPDPTDGLTNEVGDPWYVPVPQGGNLKEMPHRAGHTLHKGLVQRPSMRSAMVVANPPIGGEVDVDQDSGLEREREDSGGEIKRPFDPEKIKVRTVNIVVDQLVSRIDHYEIDLAPDFQRMAGIWNDERKSRLIESLLLRIPIPVFYVAADEDEKWSVVDGLQRTSTIHTYVTGCFHLTKLEYLTKLDDHHYTDLPRPMQRRISETQLVVNVIEPGTPEEVMFNIFRRINTGGMMLNGQEIRHALHPGPIRGYLKKLANTKEFLDATVESIKTNRMADRECVLRFIAFHVNPWEEYSENDLDGYLGRTMKKVNAMDARERDRISEDFRKAMKAAFYIFRNDAFRKRYSKGEDRRRPISKALFEAWSVGLARRSDSEINILMNKHEQVNSRFISLMNEDEEFDKAISYSTGIPVRVRKRFQAIDKLIKECL